MYYFVKRIFVLFVFLSSLVISSQNQIVTYAGGIGSEIFNDATQLSNGNFIVVGGADNMNWIPQSVSIITLPNPGIVNASGTRAAFLIEFDNTLQKMLKVYRLPSGAAEDFRFIKVTNLSQDPTGSIYISGKTSQGYFIGKLNNNFVTGSPTGFQWVKNILANPGSYQKDNQPWDVGGDGKVVYATGESHGNNWAAIHRLNSQGSDEIVNNWRIHWKTTGGEYYGKASNYPGGISGLLYSGIVFKKDASRCELRSTNQADYDLWQSDGNGGTKKGKWPLDVLFNGPCNPGAAGNSASGPGYTGYRPASTATYGPSTIAIDKRNNYIYIGFNAKSTLPGGEPDFEPAVMAMDNQGELIWWNRLYHEKRSDGSLHVSSPDQYIDALAIDYSLAPALGNIVVGARCHGNNTENFWEGNTVKATPSASGFQNNFTGNTGNIHISWLGKLSLLSGTLKNSTYMAEYADNATNLGKVHPDPNLDGWPNPNEGWPTVNTTRMSPNTLKVAADGSVIVLAKGRRTITTANAYQKMIKPSQGASAWNSFVRVYSPDLSKPLYSSLIVGQWNTSTGAEGDNVQLCGAFKTADGIVVVGQHTGTGGQIPVSNVPAWGNNLYNGQSAILTHLKIDNLKNTLGKQASLSVSDPIILKDAEIFPNPSDNIVTISLDQANIHAITVSTMEGKTVLKKDFPNEKTSTELDISALPTGIYLIRIEDNNKNFVVKKLIRK
ncbi:T9SS C-terminal target domain-containing protein [Flavobacterium circumlabens]|uniref:Secreted protein (Por secretion system target) n=1 Tax=Flavobacterium circumlabens TaxID=2133765 RepID=A0A4Y7UEL3_9FLAO|nr:T9SS type A sorting domain-containing protein [Flavobacterium circumlabens]TCN59585.1 putative secreted protein (Por secretion system target) [Flavobacterium circumlabens]TEB44867.1 T9SS C-terminal target domain-containing protein [Flavobacterium circumlabens]